MRAVRTLLALGAIASVSTRPIESARSASDEAKQKVFDRLISAIWCDQQVVETRAFHGDFNQWELRPDGTYRYDFFTDTVPRPHGTGRWSLEPSARGWIVVLDGASRRPVSIRADGTVSISSLRLRPCRPSYASSRSVAEIPSPPLPIFVFAMREAAAARTWWRANDLDLDFLPTAIGFARDWTYTSDYRFGACQNSGTWATEGRAIVAHADHNRCDLRQPSYTEDLRFHRSSNGDFLAGGDRYLGTPDPRRGTWTLASYQDSVDVTVDYPMPLRRGRPQLFNFSFVNTSGEVRTLERIALNTVNRDYRYRTRGLEKPELAALDLKRQPLQPGESVAFELPVVFDRAGAQGIYFDALIVGSRQSWDARQARQVTVHP